MNIRKYLSLPAKSWDGETPVYSYVMEEYHLDSSFFWEACAVYNRGDLYDTIISGGCERELYFLFLTVHCELTSSGWRPDEIRVV